MMLGKKTLRNLQEHVSVNGIVPRVHGNSGKKPHHALRYNEVRFVVDWLLWYSDVNGLPMPSAPRGRDGEAPILLPSSLAKKDLHKEYIQACIAAQTRQLSLSSFRNVWANVVPHIRIMSPRDDVCHKCEILRKMVADAVTEPEKLDAATSLRQHVQDAQTERQLYQQTIIEANQEMDGHVRPEGPVPPLSTNFMKPECHHTASQPTDGTIILCYWPKINMFGIRVDSISQQFNYIIDEDRSIDADGSGTHGPNAVISMLHDCLFRRGFGERSCVLHADNCGSQNKNRFMLAYLCWRIHKGLHENITMLMAIPGHTKCLVDGGFGHIKKIFKRSDCDSLGQFASIVDKSARSNHPVIFRNPTGEQTWTWYDWQSFMSQFFRPLKGIQKQHSFRFTADDKSVVYVKERSGSEEVRVKILKDNMTIPLDSSPDVLNPGGLSRERQEYLYRKVRQYVRPAFQDVTCPGFPEE